MTIERKPENTRQKIIDAAFKEIHKHGFQGMRIEQVLNNTGLKKGALYYHFSSKLELGYAVVEEQMHKRIIELWVEPLKNFTDPLEGIHTVFLERDNSWSDGFFNLGCPLNNLAQEMSPLDEGFRIRIEKIFVEWKSALSDALSQGQKKGIVDGSIYINDCVIFILAAMEGSLGLSKNHQNREAFYSCGRELKRYLNTLKAK